jgi:hypothetical protein
MQFAELVAGNRATVATANLGFFLPMAILPVALAITAFASQSAWSVTLPYHIFGSLVGPLVYTALLIAFVLNVYTIIKRNRFITFDGRYLRILGYKPIPVDQIKSVGCITDWRGVTKLVIVQESTSSYVTSFKFNESLANVHQTISALLDGEVAPG